MADEGVEYRIYEMPRDERGGAKMEWRYRWELFDTKSGAVLAASRTGRHFDSRDACEKSIGDVRWNCDAPVQPDNFRA